MLGKLSQFAAKAPMEIFMMMFGKKVGISGIVAAIKTFEDYARWNPHIQILVVDYESLGGRPPPYLPKVHW